MRLGIVTPVVSLNPRAHGAWEEDAGLEEIATVAEAADRLGPPYMAWGEHPCRRGSGAPGGARYWDPPGDVRLPVRPHRAHPLRHARARARLPPPAGHRQALRHARSGDRRAAHPRVRGGIAGRGVRPARRPLRRPRGASRRRPPRPPGVARRTSPSTTGPTTTTRGSSSTPPAVQERLPHLGGEAGRTGRCGAGGAGGRLGALRRPRRAAGRVDRPGRDTPWAERTDPLELVLYPDPYVDPIGDPGATQDLVGRYVDAEPQSSTSASAATHSPNASTSWRRWWSSPASETISGRGIS